MEYNSCALLITENCNAKCRMCCDSRGVVRGKTMSEDEILLVLKNIKDVNSIKRIGITGGEPMLYSNLIDIILGFDYGRDIKFSIKSNGFWGRDKIKADKFIDKYKDKICMLSFSYDEFHKEFINLDYIKNIIDIARKYHINTEVVGCFLKNGITPGDILNELGEYAYFTDFLYQPVIKTGSAKNFCSDDFIKLIDINKECPICFISRDKQILINSKLQVFPCCSQVVENTILEVGNLKEETLNNIIENIYTNKLLHEMIVKGFKYFKVKLDEYGITYPQYLSSPCEFCEFIFKNDEILKVLYEEGKD